MSSSFLPLKAKDELRPGTCRLFTFVSTLSNSSVMPSLRYSSFLSALRFANGRTAIDFFAVAVSGFCAAGKSTYFDGGPGGRDRNPKKSTTVTGHAHAG